MFKLLPQLFILVLLAGACSGPSVDFEKQTEIQYLDTLNGRLSEIKGLLDNVDLADIEERKEIIDNNYRFCELRFKETNIVPESNIVRLMDEYQALGTVYEKTIISYKPLVMQLEELILQVKTLKESANDKDYNKETFKTYFSKVKTDVLNLYQLAETTLKTCIETEPVFDRRQKEVEELAESLKK